MEVQWLPCKMNVFISTTLKIEYIKILNVLQLEIYGLCHSLECLKRHLRDLLTSNRLSIVYPGVRHVGMMDAFFLSRAPVVLNVRSTDRRNPFTVSYFVNIEGLLGDKSPLTRWRMKTNVTSGKNKQKRRTRQLNKNVGELRKTINQGEKWSQLDVILRSWRCIENFKSFSM